ncbi:MAG: hypothetical protein ACKVS8_10985 [Phycisphaerales bacterium]
MPLTWYNWSEDWLREFFEEFCTTRARSQWPKAPGADPLTGGEAIADHEEVRRACKLIQLTRARGESKGLQRNALEKTVLSKIATAGGIFLDKKGTEVGAIFQAEPRQKTWSHVRERMRGVFLAMTCAKALNLNCSELNLQIAKKNFLVDEAADSVRVAWATRIADYFFGAESRWFALERADIACPFDLAEAASEIRWLMWSQASPRELWMVSGGSPFLQVSPAQNSLSATGEATRDAAKAGVQVHFIYPRRGPNQQLVKQSVDAYRRLAGSEGCTVRAVDPTLLANGAQNEEEWLGRWLHPLVRCTFIRVDKEEILWMSHPCWQSNSGGGNPLTVPISNRGVQDDFAKWLRVLEAQPTTTGNPPSESPEPKPLRRGSRSK